jgi:cytoskeletal protein RodZ
LKKLLGLLLILLATAAIWWLARPQSEAPDSKPPAPSNTTAKAQKPAAPAPITSPAQVSVVTATPAPPTAPMRIEAPPMKPVAIPADYLQSIQSTPERQQAEEIALNLRNYGQRFGGNPTGTNAEIVAALRGANPARANYLPQNARLNENGEVLDPWGTPWSFHSNSAFDTEVRSAGPDMKLHTPDDIVTK